MKDFQTQNRQNRALVQLATKRMNIGSEWMILLPYINMGGEQQTNSIA